MKSYQSYLKYMFKLKIVIGYLSGGRTVPDLSGGPEQERYCKKPSITGNASLAARLVRLVKS